MQVNHQSGLLDIGIVLERKNFPPLFRDKQAVNRRRASPIHRLLEFELRKNALHHIGQRRIGRASDPRGRPRDALFDAKRLLVVRL